jgi:hypothetical protein
VLLLLLLQLHAWLERTAFYKMPRSQEFEIATDLKKSFEEVPCSHMHGERSGCTSLKNPSTCMLQHLAPALVVPGCTYESLGLPLAAGGRDMAGR